METKNFTPYPNLRFSNYDAEGRSFGVIVVKFAFDIGADGRCRPSDEQEPFVMADEFRGEIAQSSVYYPADTAPYKPKTDIILDAVTYAPGGSAAQWSCGIEIANSATSERLGQVQLDVTGPREFQWRWRSWRLTDPVATDAVPVTYEAAFGGCRPTSRDQEDGTPELEAHEFNPVGRGFVAWDQMDRSNPVPAPQIFQQGQSEFKAGDILPVAGLGPVQAAWLPRRPLGGTYDKDWEDNVWPKWATDYDFAFHNAAPEPLQVDLPPDTGLRFRLTNLHPTRPDWTIELPAMPAGLMVLQDGLVCCVALKPDTIFLDIGEEAGDDSRILVTARVVFNEQATQAITLVPLDEGANTDATLLDPPHPADVVEGGNGWPQIDGVDMASLRQITRMNA